MNHRNGDDTKSSHAQLSMIQAIGSDTLQGLLHSQDRTVGTLTCCNMRNRQFSIDNLIHTYVLSSSLRGLFMNSMGICEISSYIATHRAHTAAANDSDNN